MDKQVFKVKKDVIFIKTDDYDTSIVYKLTNMFNNRFYIRNGCVYNIKTKDNSKGSIVVKKYLGIRIPKFEKVFFKEGDLVRVLKYGRITDNKTIQVFESTGN